MENATNYTCNICVCHEKVTIGCYNEHILRSVPLAADRGQDDNAGHESTVWLMDARNDINDSNGSIMDCVNKLTFDYDSIAGDEGKDEIAGHDSTVWLMDGRNDINDSNGSIIDCVNKLTFDYDSIAGDEGKDEIAGDLYEATQNIEDWTTAVNRKDFNALNKLLNAGVQPNRNELDHVVTFLKDSSITKEICQKVCDYIKTKSEDIVSVWPAYRYSDRMKPDQIHVVFVVRTKTGDCEMQVDDYDIYERGISVYSLESRLIMEEESRSMKSDVFYDESVLQDLGHEIAACSDNLIKRHSNLNAISQGMKKSTGYEQMKRLHLSDQICIVIYVDVKGLIPLGEEPFPKYIGKFPTDVVEDSMISYVAGANDFHEQLIMGLAITAYAPDGKDNILTGTLGAFVEHLDFGPCVLTCAHILFSCEELERLKNNGYQAEFSNTRKHVHQPVGHRSMFFGTIKDAIYSEGTTELPGIDAALIKIEDPKRHPLSGNFPMAFNDINAGFDTENPLQYNSGRVCAITTSHLRKMVVKYGMKTAITKGYINSVGSTYIKRDITGATFHLKNQMEVIPIPSDVSFAMPGDSGALVMIDEDDGRVAIGILVAGYENSGKCFITPIVDILRGFKEDRLSLMKFDSSDSGIVAMDVS